MTAHYDIRVRLGRALATGFLVATSTVVRADDDLPAIHARGRLRVIHSINGRPENLSFKPGTPPGLEREMIEGFAALSRLEIEYVAVPTPDARFTALLAGKGDVSVGGLEVVEERKRQVDFTSEVFPTRHVVVTRTPHRPVETLEQLLKERVGTVKGGSWTGTALAAGVPRERLNSSFANVAELLEALRKNQVSAVVMSAGLAMLEQKDDPALELGVFVGEPVGRAWAVRKSCPQLRDALSQYVDNVRRTPTWSRLVVKYYGEMALALLNKSRLASGH
jgi:membrane-bound lytic murein transglycosylase F